MPPNVPIWAIHCQGPTEIAQQYLDDQSLATTTVYVTTEQFGPPWSWRRSLKRAL